MKTRLWLRSVLLVLPAACVLTSQSEGPPADSLTVAFWNAENLFDAADDPSNPGDDEFLPAKDWTPERYATKRAHLAGEIAAEMPHLIGFAEIENRHVLEELFAEPALGGKGWTIVHADSADTRGIDVALVFRAPFELASADAMTLHAVAREGSRPSRGVLEVRLRVGAAPLTVLVNHWPSRGGDRNGEYRAVAARVCRGVVDATLAREGRDADLLIVGDLNDDPWDASVTEHLGAVRSRNAAIHHDKGGALWNLSWTLLAEPDLGTLYYNPEWTWNVFDQVIVSRGLLDDHGLALVEGSLRVHAPEHVRDHLRRPKWFRRSRDGWTEGYSDHFMVCAELRMASGN